MFPSIMCLFTILTCDMRLLRGSGSSNGYEVERVSVRRESGSSNGYEVEIEKDCIGYELHV